MIEKESRLNRLYRIIDAGGRDVLFNMNQVQKRLFNNLHDSNITLKSRQHGITTFFCLFGLDAALHVPNMRVGIIAHNREDAERFFRDKIHYAWSQLDSDYKKLLGLTAEQSSSKELTFSNNSSIRVGTSLRSSTLHILHISEFGKTCARFPDKAREIVTGALNTVHDGAMVSIESTAEGRAGYFYDMCHDAEAIQKTGKELTRLEYKFHFFPWYDDPKNTLTPTADGVVITARMREYFNTLKTKHKVLLSHGQETWYVQKEAILGDDMKREYPSTPDEAFHQAVEGAYFKTQFDRIYSDNRIGFFPYDDGLPVHTAWDLGVSDTTAIWFFQEYGKGIAFIDYMENSGEGLGYYIHHMRERKYRYGKHFGPHDIEVRELSTGKTRRQLAKEMGLAFDVVPRLPKADQIEAARSCLQSAVFDESKCERGISALEAYRKEWDDKHGCWKDSPLHDWASNAADAFMIAAIAKPPRILYNPTQQSITVEAIPAY